ncbi:MAG: bifunctional phosphoribosyl-AMP cyclohydrolase/phosphoribosyl-ATP diphosphatase HisIE [Bdellovibrionales bacterium]
MNNFERIDWAKGEGLVPAIIQDAIDGRVLMLGYMNAEALRQTRETGKVTFFSRSKQRLWVKGETSGNFLELKDIKVDCDADTLLVRAIPVGPICHKGTATCFGDDEGGSSLGFLRQLEDIIDVRAKSDPAQSYTARLFGEGVDRIAQKVGEEGVEVALAAVGGSKEKLLEESADLLFHLLIALRHAGLSLGDVSSVLQARHKNKS